MSNQVVEKSDKIDKKKRDFPKLNERIFDIINICGWTNLLKLFVTYAAFFIICFQESRYLIICNSIILIFPYAIDCCSMVKKILPIASDNVKNKCLIIAIVLCFSIGLLLVVMSLITELTFNDKSWCAIDVFIRTAAASSIFGSWYLTSCELILELDRRDDTQDQDNENDDVTQE